MSLSSYGSVCGIGSWKRLPGWDPVQQLPLYPRPWCWPMTSPSPRRVLPHAQDGQRYSLLYQLSCHSSCYCCSRSSCSYSYYFSSSLCSHSCIVLDLFINILPNVTMRMTSIHHIGALIYCPRGHQWDINEHHWDVNALPWDINVHSWDINVTVLDMNLPPQTSIYHRRTRIIVVRDSLYQFRPSIYRHVITMS